MNFGTMKDYKLELRNLHASHLLHVHNKPLFFFDAPFPGFRKGGDVGETWKESTR